MEKVVKFKTAQQILTEWHKPFECPFMGDTFTMQKFMISCIEKSVFHNGVVDLRLFCQACREEHRHTWATSFDFREHIESAKKFGSDLLCPTCHHKIAPIPEIFFPDDNVAVESLEVTRKVSFAEVHVLQRQIKSDKSTMEAMGVELEEKDELIKDLRRTRDQQIKELRNDIEQLKGELRNVQEAACASTYMHCLQHKMKDSDEKFMLQLQLDQPANFRRVVRQKVYPE